MWGLIYDACDQPGVIGRAAQRLYLWNNRRQFRRFGRLLDSLRAQTEAHLQAELRREAVRPHRYREGPLDWQKREGT